MTRRIPPRLPALFSLAFALAMLPQPGHAAPVGDIDAALSMPFASGLVGASDAPRFAWVEDMAGLRNVWIGGEGEAAHPVTHFTADDGIEIYGLARSRDGRRIAFTRGGDAEFPDGAIPNADHGAEPPKQELFVVDAKGGKPKLVGEGHDAVFAADGALAFVHHHEIWLLKPGSGKAERIVTLEGSVGNLQFSPDSRTLLFTDNRGDHAFAALFALGGKQVRYLAPGLAYASDPTFSPDGAQVAFIRFVDPPAGGDPKAASYWSIEVADVASGATRTVWRAPTGPGGHYAGTRQQNLWWTADNRLLFPWEREGWRHVYALDLARGGEAQALTAGQFEVETFLLASDKRSLLFVGNVSQPDMHALWRVGPEGGSPQRVTDDTGIESYPALGGASVAMIATDIARPAHVVLASAGHEKALGPVDTLEGVTAPQPVTYRAADGVLVHAQLFPGKGTGPHPALVFVHGGPSRQMLLGFNAMDYYSNAYAMNQHLADKGFTVLSVNYRSGTGYGTAFRDAPGIARDGASEYRDVLAGGKWLAARADVDAKRIGIWGGSWGGYLTALALARNSDLFAAGVDFHGVHTMLRPVPDSLAPGDQARARDLQWSSSPFGSLDQWRSPVLIIHGDDDHNVDFSQSVLLARELTARQVPYEDLVFPNERHGFLRHADWLVSYRATDDFLTRRLMPPRNSRLRLIVVVAGAALAR
ncbi:S9 family peptidase [Novosphingobium sp. 9]|uniref:S9 family peptidase n=1 Tax=Novosphingobium sp. 9 TaxID=2025349 RepID=UPI0021B62711|nr:alpha/beta fold hydrolase [Novosphingobium sp. 9]